MKLSEKLEAMLHARLTDEDSILREAMELAKRYEDAPVIGFYGQRARILLDTEGV